MKKKKEADGRQPPLFDNPKTNLTYKKNLFILTFKNRATIVEFNNISLKKFPSSLGFKIEGG